MPVMQRLAVLVVLAACGTPAAPIAPPDAAPPQPACSEGPAGSQHGLTLQSGGETRTYFLHVPATVACASPAPLWIDFHGTAGDPAPEEAYGLAGAIAAADREGVILVRPRSRSSVEDGGNIYRWDENDGDIDRNRAYVHDLVAALAKDYAIDPARIFVTGFSSGANMASQYLRPDELPVIGIGNVGGGFWDVSASELTRIPPHIYTITGYRDYMVQNFDPLRDLLRANASPDTWYWRQVDTGHDLYAWHYDEILPWILRGDRRPDGSLAAGWTDESIATDKAILDLAPHTGELVAVGSEGSAWHRGATGWAPLGGIPSSTTHLTSVCVDGDTLYATGQQTLFRSTDGGTTFTSLPSLPELEGEQFGSAFLETARCGAGQPVLAAGWWVSDESSDSASTWAAAPMVATYDSEANVIDAARGDDGTEVAVGYDGYVGTRAPGGAFVAADLGFDVDWFNAVATSGQAWWVVGEAGALRVSTDNGATWASGATGTSEDLYAVAFRDGQTGAAAGLHGAVVITRDGGATWQDISLGVDRFVGAVAWLDANTLLVAGERGLVATMHVQ